MMRLPLFAYHCPKSLLDLDDFLTKNFGGAKILAGGTDLLLQMKRRLIEPSVLIDIASLTALQGIFYEEGKGITIMAGTKIANIEESRVIRDKFFALYQSARHLGSSQVRAMATLGGNSCNASPSAETPPILIALGSQITVAGSGLERVLPLESFFLGYRKVDLNPGEYLKSFLIPEQPRSSYSAYLCHSLRRAMEVDIVNVGLWFTKDENGKCKEARIAIGSVAPTPIRARKAEAALMSQLLSESAFQRAGEEASNECSPIDDIRGSAEYRREIVKVLVPRALRMALKQNRGIDR